MEDISNQLKEQAQKEVERLQKELSEIKDKHEKTLEEYKTKIKELEAKLEKTEKQLTQAIEIIKGIAQMLRRGLTSAEWNELLAGKDIDNPLIPEGVASIFPPPIEYERIARVGGRYPPITVTIKGIEPPDYDLPQVVKLIFVDENGKATPRGGVVTGKYGLKIAKQYVQANPTHKVILRAGYVGQK